jgi:hypothetical protein
MPRPTPRTGLRLALPAAAVLMLTTLTFAATPELPIADRTRALFESYNGVPEVIWSPELRDQWFSPRMIVLLEKEDACAKGDVGNLDHDPVVGGQDFEITDITVAVTDAGPNRKRATVKYKSLGNAVTRVMEWTKTKDGWRIDEIDPGTDDELSTILDRPCPKAPPASPGP